MAYLVEYDNKEERMDSVVEVKKPVKVPAMSDEDRVNAIARLLRYQEEMKKLNVKKA